MAIAFDAASTNSTTGTSVTATHVCTGSNLILFAAVQSDSGDTLTGVTYNSVSMTQVGKRQVDGTGAAWVYLYYLAGPATGSNSLTASFSGSSDVSIEGASYTGASQTGIPDAFTTNGNSSTSALTTSVTTIADNCWTVLSANAQRQVSAGAGTTLRQGASVNQRGLFDSNSAKTPAGSTSLVVNLSSAAQVGVVMASFAPSTAAPVSNSLRFLSLLGVGQ